MSSFPLDTGISDRFSPGQIVISLTTTFNKHCKHEFGDYIQTHESYDNGMSARTVAIIALRSTGHAQGGYYFYSLQTGWRIDRSASNPPPSPDPTSALQLIINDVHALADQALM